MTESTTMRVTVLVKAAPVLTRDLNETMCVAGARVDGATRTWVRLHPVPFRDLADAQKFVKYQTVSVEVRRPKTDRRPESWAPVPGTIGPGDLIRSGDSWAMRRHLVAHLGESTMCELVEANRTGSGPGTPSLAVVRPLEPPKLVITERDAEQV